MVKYEWGSWRVDITSPIHKGIVGLAVDSKGQPAFVAAARKRFPILYKKGADGWVTIKACSLQVAFGENDVFYRLGCDWFVYLMTADGEWGKLSERKAY